MLSKSIITASVETLQTILNAVPSPVFLIDPNHRVVLANDALCEFLSRTRDEIIDGPNDFVPKEQSEIFAKIDDEVFATGQSNENEEVLTDGNGSLHIILTRKRLIQLPTSEGVQPFIIAVISDVTQFREAEAHAKFLAEHDALTGLANRSQLSDRLMAAIETARKTGGKAAVLLLDLDNFKSVNDNHGHPVGDELLRIVAKRLAGQARSVDTVSRYGGDEFCVVQVTVQRPDDALGLAQRIMSSMSRPIVLGSVRLSITVSIGIALIPDDGMTPEIVLRRADMALYEVKRSGRHDYRLYQGSGSGPLAHEWNMEADLQAALAAGELSLAFQPLAAATDGKVRGFEALARWQHPTRGDVPPQAFIAAAESTGLIQQLGSWVLHQACASAAGWPWDSQVAVNVSPTELENDDFPATVASALAASGLPASRLELEVTETALLDGSPRLLRVFAELKALGVSLALDDFGAGWSSLATLRNFHFDRIKIDRSFIAHIASDARSVAIVRAVLSLGQALELPVTAEGVEDQGQLAALRQMGCDELQGFLLGRPRAEAALPDVRLWHSKSDS